MPSLSCNGHKLFNNRCLDRGFASPTASAHRQLTGSSFGQQPFFPIDYFVHVASSRPDIALYRIHDGRSVTSRWRFNQSEEE
jgi:hypothetical protein